MARFFCGTVLQLSLAMALLMFAMEAFASSTRGRWGAARAQAARLEMSIEAFQLDCGRLPYALDELLGVVSHGDCVAVEIERLRMLLDPWDNPFFYWRAADGRTFEVRSIGPDRVFASADDAVSRGWSWPWPNPYTRFRPNWQGIIELVLPALIGFVLIGWPFIVLVRWCWSPFQRRGPR